MKRHVFVTGRKREGKSTAVDRTLSRLDRSPCGFYTFFDGDRASPNRRLVICDARYGRSTEHARELVRFKSGCRPFIVPGVFDDYAAGLIRPGEGDGVIIMDECGGFESECADFRRAVMEALDGPVPVLGVLREGLGSWRDEIRSHPAVTVLELTFENRAALPERIASLLGQA